MFDIAETENIYFAKSKGYFKEVLSSYANGNYRSAVVMLYSIAVCDLLFKLQELHDLYGDTIAKQILDEVEKDRTSNESKSRSQWEKSLIEKIYRRTDLLDDKSYTDLMHLNDHRNFSAHPAMNKEYDLVSPSQETTIADIKNTVDNILAKPPIFAKSIVDTLTEDLEDKKDIFKQKSDLDDYLSKKYFGRMSSSMKKKAFRSFWKLCFIMSDDERCDRNRTINRRAMECLYSKTEGINDYISSDAMFTSVTNDPACMGHLCGFLSEFPEVYKCLKDDIKLQIKHFIEEKPTLKLIAWFTCANKKVHLNNLNATTYHETYPEGYVRYAREKFKLEGLADEYYDFSIKYFGMSRSFDTANERYRVAIQPILDHLKRSQFISLIAVINGNDQIYNRNACLYTDNEILRSGLDQIGKDFDFSQYPNFKYSEDVLEPKEDVDDSNEEDILS